jgi:hypothetical protein
MERVCYELNGVLATAKEPLIQCRDPIGSTEERILNPCLHVFEFPVFWRPLLLSQTLVISIFSAFVLNL